MISMQDEELSAPIQQQSHPVCIYREHKTCGGLDGTPGWYLTSLMTAWHTTLLALNTLLRLWILYSSCPPTTSKRVELTRTHHSFLSRCATCSFHHVRSSRDTMSTCWWYSHQTQASPGFQNLPSLARTTRMDLSFLLPFTPTACLHAVFAKYCVFSRKKPSLASWKYAQHTNTKHKGKYRSLFPIWTVSANYTHPSNIFCLSSSPAHSPECFHLL